jgi:succinate dehydrogenase / fumarate reductase membrane anchor subunit
MAAITKPKGSFESIAWRWMRYSGILLIPLAWFHVYLQDVIVGVHAIDIDYVAVRLADIGWVTYDFFLLLFTFAHGMYGLRQVMFDLVHNAKTRRVLSILMFIFWLAISIIGATALVMGARPELAQ